MTDTEMFAVLEDYGICSQDFIDGAICAGGYSEQTAERILFYHTGWDSFEGFLSQWDEEEE